MIKLYLVISMAFACNIIVAQSLVRGRITDATTKYPLEGATVSASRSQAVVTGSNGKFALTSGVSADTVNVTCIGYIPMAVVVSGEELMIALTPRFANLDEIIVSANREIQKRTEVPVAINVISPSLINDTKATRLDMLINKVPGAFMVDLGNEQHSMSVRQPLGYSSLYLYMEDGIPIRTVGDFNHNALIEINQAAVERIEVIKGPASSLYGSEAIGGAINFITPLPSQNLNGKIQAEVGSRGYKRTDFSISNTIKKLGFYAGGYYVNQNQADDQHNDFRKAALTLRADYAFSDKTKLVTTADIIRYKTDQKGGLDSSHFYSKDYISSYRFTYRRVDALRLKSTLSKDWNSDNKSTFTLVYRNTAIGQNPFYSIGNLSNPLKAKGQINEDAFNSYAAFFQHSTKFRKGKWISGVSVDLSPATYYAKYIDIDRDSRGAYYKYSLKDSLLTDYRVNLLNSAVYTQVEYNPFTKLRFVLAARYDRLDYKFDNHLPSGAFTGAPDNSDHFDHFTPKAGITYDLGKNNGLYVNYSAGFAPPNITDLYTGVKVPVLKPSSYNNYEVGGWLSFNNGRGHAEVSLYKLNGTNEIVSVRLPDGTYQNQNVGITEHKGIEVSIKYAPVEELTVRVGGTIAKHTYDNYVLQGKDYSGNDMPQAPGYIVNSEVTYKPAFIKGFRISLEYQGLGKYFTDPQNTASYKGFNIFNARAGYNVKAFEIWVNCLNAADEIYATTVEKSIYGTSYRPGQLRSINVGIGYHFKSK